MTSYRSCAVPMCLNTTIKCPNKLFISVPQIPKRRKQWLQLARRNKFTSDKSSIVFCEDHFDLPKDMENYMEYKLMGKVNRIRMRPDSLPSKFECQPDRRKRTAPLKPRSAVDKRRRMDIIKDIISEEKQRPSVTFLRKSGKKRSEHISGSAGQQHGADGEENYILVVGEVEEAKRVPPSSSHQPLDQEQSLLVKVEERTLPTATDQPVEAQQNNEEHLEQAQDDSDTISCSSTDEALAMGFEVIQHQPDDERSCSPLLGFEPTSQEQELVEVKTEEDEVCQDGTEPEEDVATEEMMEVKIEVEEQSDVPPDPLLEYSPDAADHQAIEVVVKEEPLDIDQGDPSPEQELERYRELYNKVKEDVTRLEVENQRLADENQLLSAKLHGFTNRIEDLLQKHEKRKATSDEQAVKQIESVVITNLKMDKRNLAEENKKLLKKIDDLLKKVDKQTEEIKEMMHTNRCLSNEIQDLSDVNKQLTVKLEVFSKEKNLTRTAEDVYVFVQKIKILSDDVKRLKEENETLRQEIEDLTRRNKGTTDRIVKNYRGTYEFKRKHYTSDRNEETDDETDTDDNVANITHKMKRKQDLILIHIDEDTADELEENIAKETHKTKRKQDLMCRSIETSEESETEENVVKEIVKRKRKQELTHRNTTESSEDLEPTRRTGKRRRKT